MNDHNNRILGRVLAVDETAIVSGAKQTAVTADTQVDINGNSDTARASDSGTAADNTVPVSIDIIISPDKI